MPPVVSQATATTNQPEKVGKYAFLCDNLCYLIMNVRDGQKIVPDQMVNFDEGADRDRKSVDLWVFILTY